VVTNGKLLLTDAGFNARGEHLAKHEGDLRWNTRGVMALNVEAGAGQSRHAAIGGDVLVDGRVEPLG
jgi:hypothetical protein